MSDVSPKGQEEHSIKASELVGSDITTPVSIDGHAKWGVQIRSRRPLIPAYVWRILLRVLDYRLFR